jgi:hypothetical protein
MSPAKNLYVRPGRDEEVWRRAERYAEEHRMSLSVLATIALERFLAEEEGREDA